MFVQEHVRGLSPYTLQLKICVSWGGRGLEKMQPLRIIYILNDTNCLKCCDNVMIIVIALI